MDVCLRNIDHVGDIIIDFADPEHVTRGYTEGWPLTDFRTAFAITLGYLSFVALSPLIMKSKSIPLLELYAVKFCYNAIQIIICSYCAVEAALLAYRSGYLTSSCSPYNAKDPVMANISWIFYLTKILDLLDTFFIIVGKKHRQLSFLHVYHHAVGVFLRWACTKFYYDGEVYSMILMNSFVHAIMYTYFFVTMHTKDPVWWKSSLTVIQLIQFVVLVSHNAAAESCSALSPRWMRVGRVWFMIQFVLFLNFYVKSYVSVVSSSSRQDAGRIWMPKVDTGISRLKSDPRMAA